MRAFTRLAAFTLAAALSLGCLAACSNNNASSTSSSSDQASAEAAAPSVSREEIDKIVDAAVKADYTSLGFSTTTESTATYTENGQMQQQVVDNSMVGEIDRTPENPRMHMTCTYKTNTTLGATTYDMYIDNSSLFVTQGDQLYRDEPGENNVENYAQSITSIASKEQIDKLLDVASSYKVEEKDGNTTISITADVDKLVDSKLLDASSLPEGSSVATLVASYTIDSDNHFKTVRIMSSTTGTPTYRVSQTYQYYDYNKAVMPEWPDWQNYIAKQAGILTDEAGRMYLIADDGLTYYIESISPDGTINFDPSSISTSTGGEAVEYTYEYYPEESTTTSVPTNNPTAPNNEHGASGSSTSEKGRAYITAADGTIHYLDEEGSSIQDLGGTLVFIDANGEWYFLDVAEGEDLSEYMKTKG